MRLTQEQAAAKARRWAMYYDTGNYRRVLRGRSGRGRSTLQTTAIDGGWRDEGGEWLTKSVFEFLYDALTSHDFTASALRKVVREAKAILPVIDCRGDNRSGVTEVGQ